MEGKGYIVIVAVLIVVLLGLVFLWIRGGVLGSPAQLEECKTIKYNGENAINIVIFADKATAEKYATYFFTISPFNRARGGFNFYYIDSYNPVCEEYKGMALLCYSKDILKKAASCPNDFIVVIKGDNAALRSSNYMNVMSINSAHQLSVFQHEFGHSFAALSDEYTPAEIPRKAKNCPSSCDEFAGNSDGCFGGCSKDERYRSIDIGIMRTLSSNSYGKFDEALLLEKIKEKGITLAGSAVNEGRDCVNERYALIKGTYKGGKIEISEKGIELGCVGENGAGDFSYSMEIEGGNVLKQEEFNPEFIFVDKQDERGIMEGGNEKREGEFYLKIPSVENARSLKIKDFDNNTVAEISLKDLGARACRM